MCLTFPYTVYCIYIYGFFKVTFLVTCVFCLYFGGHSFGLTSGASYSEYKAGGCGGGRGVTSTEQIS